jgi:hypothetical protein
MWVPSPASKTKMMSFGGSIETVAIYTTDVSEAFAE